MGAFFTRPQYLPTRHIPVKSESKKEKSSISEDDSIDVVASATDVVDSANDVVPSAKKLVASPKEVVAKLNKVNKKEEQAPTLVKDILMLDDNECQSGIHKTKTATSKPIQFPHPVFRKGALTIFCTELGRRRGIFSSKRAEDIPLPERPWFLVKTLLLLMIALSLTFGGLMYENSELKFRKFYRGSNYQDYIFYGSIAGYFIILSLLFSRCSTIEPGNLIVYAATVLCTTVLILLVKPESPKSLYFAIVLVPISVTVVVGLLFLLALTSFNFAHRWLLYFAALVFTASVLSFLFLYYVPRNFDDSKFLKEWKWYIIPATTYYVLCICIQLQLILLGYSFDLDETHYIFAAVLLYFSYIIIAVELVILLWCYFVG